MLKKTTCLYITVGQSAVLVINSQCNDVESACANYGVARQCGVVEPCFEAWSNPVTTVSYRMFNFSYTLLLNNFFISMLFMYFSVPPILLNLIFNLE